jgi:hypothetical protein
MTLSVFVFPKAAAIAEERLGPWSNEFYNEILAPAGLVPARPRKHKAQAHGRSVFHITLVSLTPLSSRFTMCLPVMQSCEAAAALAYAAMRGCVAPGSFLRIEGSTLP